MPKPIVAIAKGDGGTDHFHQAIELCGGLDHLPAGASVFIKPNVVFWTRHVPFPKYGVITTSPLVETVVKMLKDKGAGRIIIGEGTVTAKRNDRQTVAHAFETLGYNKLAQRYGLEVIDVMDRPFQEVETPAGLSLNFNIDFLESDFLVNLPVLKTHAQARVSLGIKNLKGLIDIKSRKRCHRQDEGGLDLGRMVSVLPVKMPPSLTVIDGTYSNERGPAFDGTMRRLDLCLAGTDMLAVDMVGAAVLGQPPDQVPHLIYRAADLGRSLDLEEVDIRGLDPDEVTVAHEYAFPYTPDDSLPLGLAQLGIKGLSYPKYDDTMCTYCSVLNIALLPSIARAWLKRAEDASDENGWDEIEVLTGKIVKPTPGKKTTLLLGNCICKANRDHPDINEAVLVPGCPINLEKLVKAFHGVGIMIDPAIVHTFDLAPGAYHKRYLDKPEFDPAHFRID